jgi:hypothetical protein
VFHAFGTSRRAHFGFAATVTLTLLSTLLSQPSSAREPVAASAVVKQSSLAAGAAEEVGLVPELATATSNTYREGDGSMRLESFTEPVNYLSEDQTWVPIDNELIPAPGAAYEVMNAGNSFEAKIPADPSTTPVSFATEDAWVTMRMHGLDDAPSVDGEVATFEDVAGADEVTYEVTNTGLKEDILLEDAPSLASGALKYTYSIDASAGITPAVGLEGAIEFRDPAGEAVVVMPAAYMFDSASPEPATSHDVTYDLTPAGAGWKLTVTPSMQWLQDAARVYPVTIDPTLGNAPASKDCWIRDTTPTATACGDTATYVKVGRSSGPVNYRGLLDFDTSSIPDTATVDTAEIPLYLDHTQSTSAVTGDYALFRAGKAWSGSSATWSSSGASGAWEGGDAGGTAYGTLTLNGTTSGFKIFGRDEVSGAKLKELVQGWVTSPNSKTGLVLKQAGTPTLNVLSFYSSAPAASNDNKRPRLNVNYTVPAPAAPIIQSMAVSGCVEECGPTLFDTGSVTPTITATASDSDTSTLTYQFSVRRADDLTVKAAGSMSAPQSSAAVWAAPVGSLEQGEGYEFRVTATDGLHSAASAWTALWVVGSPTQDVPDLANGECVDGLGGSDDVCIYALVTESEQDYYASDDFSAPGRGVETIQSEEAEHSLAIEALTSEFINGNPETAQAFIEARGESFQDATQVQLEALAADPPPPAGSEEGAQSTNTSSTQAAASSSKYGELVRKTRYWSGCSCSSELELEAVIRFEFRTWLDIFAPVSMSGNFDVQYGPRVYFTTISCKIKFDQWGFDSTIFTYTNCPKASDDNFAMNWVWISPEEYNGAFTQGATYYQEYEIRVNPKGSLPPRWLKYQTRRWKTSGYPIVSNFVD